MIPLDSVGIKQLQRAHPLYVENLEQWQTIKDVRERRLRKPKYLPRAPIENESLYQTRVKMTRFVSEAITARNRVLGAVFALNVDRQELAKIDTLATWARRADKFGRPLHVWIEAMLAPKLSDFGVAHVLVDRPPAEAAEPFVHAYDPIAVRNWSVNANGVLEWIVIVEDRAVTRGPLGATIPVREYRVFDLDSWHVWRTTPADPAKGFQPLTWSPLGEPVVEGAYQPDKILLTGDDAPASGSHGSEGQVPVISFLADPSIPMVSPSPISAAVELDLKRLALESDQTWDLYVHAHPMLVIKSTKSPDQIGVGSSIFQHLNPEENESIQYTAPPSESFAPRREDIQQTLRDTHRHTSGDQVTERTGDPETGIAIERRFAIGEGRHVGRFANRLEEGENALHRLVARFLNVTIEDGLQLVSYPDKPEETATIDRVETGLASKQGVRSPTFKREVEKDIVRHYLGHDAPREVLDAIDRDIEQLDEPRPAPILPGLDAE